MDVPEFTLKEVHLVLEGFRAAYEKRHHIIAKAHPHTRQSSTNTSKCNCVCVRLRPTNVLVQETDESGSHDVSVFAAKLHWRLYPIIHH